MTCNISAENKGTAAERFNCHSRLLKTRYGGGGGGGVGLSIPLPCMLEGYNVFDIMSLPALKMT